jgi:nucleoside-diphosphate-sugar epimerase
VRDFIHIRDIVDAVDECVKNGIYGTYNLGTGRPVSFNELCDMVCKQQNYAPKIQHIPTAPTGVMYRVCDPSSMLSFYRPKISLEEGISRALQKK